MSTILVTGTSGLIGRALAASLAEKHAVIGMSRSVPADLTSVTHVPGAFYSFEDLRQLDSYEIDAAIHLAAVTGGGKERDQILVNVEGTRCLLKYLAARGCRKFVLASSIAAIGFQSPEFRPLELPIPDEHPCLDRNGYGLSKFLMEEVSKYCARQNPDIDVINLRLSSVASGERTPAPGGIRPLGMWSLGGITRMVLTDAVRAFTLAAESPCKPGARVLNAAAPRAWASVPTAKILRHWYGDHVDVSFFEQPGNEFAGVYLVERIRDEIGFVAEDTLTQLENYQA